MQYQLSTTFDSAKEVIPNEFSCGVDLSLQVAPSGAEGCSPVSQMCAAEPGNCPEPSFFRAPFLRASGRLQTVWDARRPVTPLLRTHGLVVTRGASIALVSKFLLARGSRTTKFSRIRSVCVLVMIGAPGPLPYP